MSIRLWRGAFDAVVLDLDGVLTLTARVHALAWKDTLDEYLRGRAEQRGEPFVPFDADADYRRYVDGRPRDEGVMAFLESRGIRVPHGSESNAPDRETVWGLGNRKRDRFLALLGSHGVDVDEHAAGFVRGVRVAGIRTAVVSSSRNCRAILDAARLSALFDLVLDGTDRARLGLPGKPAPDMFLEAARRLAVDPLRTVIVEDALVGVAAGRRGGFGCVIGVDRGGALRAAGADIAVADLSDVVMTPDPVGALRPDTALPSALEELDHLLAPLDDRRLAVFLDYDGTLAPIVSRPEDARLPEETRLVLRELARAVPVAIVSGRDLSDVMTLVGIESLFYAGSHGFEIVAPDGRRLDDDPGAAFREALGDAERDLLTALHTITGVQVERKAYAVAVHFRRADERDVPRVAAAVDAVAAARAGLRRTEGKKVFELRPDIEWHKGAALSRVMSSIDVAPARILPLYIGDDVTDEDAFLAVAREGIPVVVRDERRLTYARYALDGITAVRQFLAAIRGSLARESRS